MFLRYLWENHKYLIFILRLGHIKTEKNKTSQFKRSCVPNSPKVGSGGSLSPHAATGVPPQTPRRRCGLQNSKTMCRNRDTVSGVLSNMKVTDLGKDLTDPRWMYLKAVLFGVAGLACVAGILVEHFEWRTALFLFIAIWSFCRLYYFAFYVIEKYIDPSYKFAGLRSFLLYLLRHKKG